MQKQQIALRYARALLAVTDAAGDTDAVQAELAQLRRLIAGSPELAALLAHAALSRERQAQAVTAVFEGRCRPDVLRFLRFLIERRRLGLLDAICDAYLQLYREARGIQRATIECADALREEQLAAIRDRLHTRHDKTIEPTVVVNRALIGGFRIRVADTVYDYSILGKLERMKQALVSA